MLSSLRKFAGGWVATIFIGLLVLSFALFGINDIFTGGAANTLATVGDREITVDAYRNALQRRTNELNRTFGTTLTFDQLRGLGVPQQTVQQLINDAALEQRAAQYGFARSEEGLAAEIVEGPAFKDADGDFDRGLFNQVLRANGLNEATYIVSEKAVSARNQLTYPVRAEIPAPSSLDEALRRYRLEERTLRVIDVSPEALPAIDGPDEATLAAYFDENAARFRAPEYRSLTYIRLEPQDLVATVDVSEADIEAAYEARRADFVSEERRTLRQIAFANAAEAEAAAERLADGARFSDIAAERGLSEADVALGTVAPDDLIDPAVAEAAFALEVGEVSAPIAGQFTTVLVTADAIEEGVVRPLDEVRGELRDEAALRIARQSILDAYDAIEDARAAGETPNEIAERLELTAVTVERVDRTGALEDGGAADLPDPNLLLPALFDAEPDFEPFPIQTAEGYLFFEVDEVIPSRPRTLDEARAEATAARREAETAAAVSTVAREIVEAANDGETLIALAEARGLTIRDVGPITRAGAPGVVEAAVRQMFATPLGEAGSAEAEDGRGRIVFMPLTRTVPDVASDEAPELGIGQDVLAQYVTAVRGEMNVETNEAVLQSALGTQ